MTALHDMEEKQERQRKELTSTKQDNETLQAQLLELRAMVGFYLYLKMLSSPCKGLASTICDGLHSKVF